MHMHHVRLGQGNPLLLIHGLGSSWRSWRPVLEALALEREVIAIDLPGFGDTPPLPGEVSIDTLADAVTSFLVSHDRVGIDAVGSSMGARLVLELARRRVIGATVSLDPGGFWRSWEKDYFLTTIGASVRLVRGLGSLIPRIVGTAAGRAMLFAQFSAHPSRIPVELARDEMSSFATSPSFDELLLNLVHGPDQRGAERDATLGPVTIGWGTKDRVCLPRQAKRVIEKFPGASIHWFDDCGHFPQWDSPDATARMILARTGSARRIPNERPHAGLGLHAT